MIETGLPYDMSQINDIKENGALVDMNNIVFPNIEDNIRVSLIYLRNTDFNVSLDFSKCDYNFKSKCLLFYITGDIIYNIQEYDSTIQKIISKYNNFNDESKSILSDDEIDRFINENNELVNQINTFLFSLSLYAITRLDWEDGAISYDDINHCNKSLFNKNIYNIIDKQFINFLLLDTSNKEINPLFFDEHFNKNNEELFFKVVTETPYATLLYGMTTGDEWTKFVDNIIDDYNNLKSLDSNISYEK